MVTTNDLVRRGFLNSLVESLGVLYSPSPQTHFADPGRPRIAPGIGS